MEQNHSTRTALINKQISEAKGGLLYSSLSCVGFLTLGGIITGITYSLAEPGGTYVATTGLFLVGMISGVVAVWRLIQLLFYLTKRGSSRQPIAPQSHQQSSSNRTWEDLN